MTKVIKSLDELKDIVYKKWSELDNINARYLNDAGVAAKEAYRAIIWHIGFHDTLETLYNDDMFINLVAIPDKHAEYYKTLRLVNRAIEKSLV